MKNSYQQNRQKDRENYNTGWPAPCEAEEVPKEAVKLK